MPNVSVIPQTASASRTAIRYQAAGILDENYPFAGTNTTAGVTSQRVYASLLGLRVGDSVTGIALKLSTAAAGTAPALARFGIADSTGKILALSGDLGAATNWTLGAPQFAFAAPYVVTAQGGYYACFVVNGTWGTTQASIATATVAGTGAVGALTGAAPAVFTWDAQTDLPAVNSSLTMTALQASRWMAFYGSGSV